MKTKGAGTRAEKNFPISIRLTPKIRYLADLLAREQHRTMTNLIEWALIEALKNGPHLLNEGLWDLSPAKRLVLLAGARPDLLTEDERVLCGNINAQKTFYDPKKGKYNYEALDAVWDEISDQEN